MNRELLEKAHELIDEETLIDRKEVVDFFKDPLKHSKDIAWFHNEDSVMQLAHVLVDEVMITRTEDLLYYFEKPWKYDKERKELIDKGVIYD